MSSAVLLEPNTVELRLCDTLILESKSVNRQTEVLLDLGLLSWYTAGSGFLISVGQKEHLGEQMFVSLLTPTQV